MQKSWTIDPIHGLEEEEEDEPDQMPMVADDLSSAGLLLAVDQQHDKFMDAARSFAARLPAEKPKVRRRAKDFVHIAEGVVVRELKTVGFHQFLLRIKENNSVEATVRLFAEFVAFAKHKCNNYARFELQCCQMCVYFQIFTCLHHLCVCTVSVYRWKALKILFDVATNNHGLIEAYNKLLNGLSFQPRTIATRMEAIAHAITFLRFDVMLCVVHNACLLVESHSVPVCSSCVV